MVLGPDVIRERIAHLRAAIVHLRLLRGVSVADKTTEWAIERGVQLAAQSVFDIGNHILSGSFGERPSDYASVPPLLLDKGVIAADLETRLRGLAGFRNLLVHDYTPVDPMRLRMLLDGRLEDFSTFAASVEAWLDTQEAPTSA